MLPLLPLLLELKIYACTGCVDITLPYLKHKGEWSMKKQVAQDSPKKYLTIIETGIHKALHSRTCQIGPVLLNTYSSPQSSFKHITSQILQIKPNDAVKRCSR